MCGEGSALDWFKGNRSAFRHTASPRPGRRLAVWSLYIFHAICLIRSPPAEIRCPVCKSVYIAFY